MSLLKIVNKAPVKAATPEGPVPKGMLSTQPSLERYRRATVKQIVAFFDGAEFVVFVKKLERIAKATGAKNHTEVFINAVEFWEQHHLEGGK